MAEQGPETSLLGKIAGYTEILSKDPRSTVFVPLSEAYRKMKMLDDAIAVASKGVAALPNYAPGYIALARAQAEHGQVSEAALAFENVLRIEAENLQGLKGLARVRMMQSRIEDAHNLLAKAKQLAPDDQQIDSMLASLNQGGGRPKTIGPAPVVEAIQETEAPIATATLAEIYVRQGLHRKAFNIYRELYQSEPHNRGLFSRMTELQKLLDLEDAGTAGPLPMGEAPKAASVTPVKAETSPVAPPASGKPSAAGEVQARLNHWLELIRRRRLNV